MYLPVILSAVVGIFSVVLGIGFMAGLFYSINLSDFVPEENKAAFYKAEGLGFLLLGIALLVFAVFTFFARYLDKQIYSYIGLGVAIVPFVFTVRVSKKAKEKYEVRPDSTTDEE